MTPSSTRRSSVRTTIDALESRRLLAAVTFASGTLTLTGTAAAETFVVQPKAGDATMVEASVDGTVVQTVSVADLTNIVIFGNDGDDKITVSESLTFRAVLHGGNGNDTIHGGGGNDFVAGEKGNDYTYGGGGKDLVTTGAGKNHAYGEDGDDKVVGSSGHDFIYGGAGRDRLYGDLGDDLLDGGGGNDTLYGSSGRDLLLGGTGNDRLYGNSEADTLGGGLGRDTLIGGENSGDDVALSDKSTCSARSKS